MSRHPRSFKARVQREIELCAHSVFLELTRGRIRNDLWYGWFLCERHGGQPLIDPMMHPKQVAYWDGEDIVVAGKASIREIALALPEELAHRLSGADSCRFEPMNFSLRYSLNVARNEFQERVGQRVAELFAQRRSMIDLD